MSRPLFDHIRFQARLRPRALAVFGPGGSIAYRALVDDVDALATELLEHGLTRRDMVGLQLGFSYLHLLLILALDRLSIPSMSFLSAEAAPGPAPVGVTAIMSANPAPADTACRWIRVADMPRPTLGKPDAARLAVLDSPADSLLRVTWSSGTTGGAKGSPLVRSVQARRLAMRRALWGLGPHSRYFTGMAFGSGAGYAPPLAVLAGGGAVILPDPATDFVSLANMVGVTVSSAAPSMVPELFGAAGGVPRRLETVELFQIVGAPPPSKLVRDALAFLTPHLSIGYGSTEVEGIAFGDAALSLGDPGVAGYVTSWVDAEIVDPAGHRLPFGQEGQLRVRADHMVAGYYANPAATLRNFRDGWFYPGDIGAITEHGLLRITGRVEDVIVRDGVAISPLPIEEAIGALPQVREVAAFALHSVGGAQEICAAVVLEPGSDPHAIGTAAAARLGDRAPVRLFVIDRLPRNATGKVMRRLLVDWAMRSAKP